ncbi:hypothetical protein EJ065_6595 [Corallococcus coralloides]|uniref:DUF2381 family protein n=1 Tax=Corallococcus coralloides TaxID=184914 RepID=A0A410S280_CORCK|nr:DUF2381 family protein [Corallococcus coralloides]QAT88121.1 hypothetical protein EJ065_6595 [Corallococcus coralloides]RYZ16776.1 MAG: DUF2381 family protein [Myxococcaceae bacterium]
MTSSSTVVLLGLLLTNAAAFAQAEGLASGPGSRRIELSPDESPSVSEVMISAGLSTGFYFDSDLARDGVELEGRERFSLVDMGQATLRLIPSWRVVPGERFRLMVRFKEGAAPASASFLLRVHPAKAEPLVEVYRGTRTLETYQQEVQEVRAELVRCQEENSRLVSEHEAPGGLTGLLATQTLDENGVAARVVTKDILPSQDNALADIFVTTYRTKGAVAVVVQLATKAGASPWSAKGATLRGRTGATLKVLRVWQQQFIPPGEARRIVVEAEVPDAGVQGPYSLKLWEDGPRTITLGNVTFP